MTSDNLYEACLPILQDPSIEEEDKTDKLEGLIRDVSGLANKSLENAVLDVLWRFRDSTSNPTGSSPSKRQTVVRRNSPAPWQISRSGTPVAGASPPSQSASPVSMPILMARPALMRMKSSQRSPFTSPRASPRLAFASPQLSHSNLKPNESTGEKIPGPDTYGDYTGDYFHNNEDANSSSSSTYGGDYGSGADWVQPQMMDMSPYDLLRSILQDQKSDEEIEAILEANGYDLSAAIVSLMGAQSMESQTLIGTPEQSKQILVGKSMAPGSRPATPAGQAKSNVVCRYWLSSGQCFRADCRFSHDLTSHVCKYWLTGNCLAGESCVFSHDPSALMNNLSLSNTSYNPTQSLDSFDYNSFPSLQGNSAEANAVNLESSLRNLYPTNETISPPPGFSSRPALAPEFIPSRPISRLSSTPSRTNVFLSDDNDSFPSLGSAAARGPKKHHGKRGHGHGHREKEIQSSSLADVVRMVPSPNPISSPRKQFKARASYNDGDNGAAAQSIAAPEHIPWLETGERANRDYLKARAEAIKHGSARNKFLQSAAQAWNRNDVRAAKALSLRGQSENDLMREAHRTAARHLYDQRNKTSSAGGGETFIDLHGLHPAEAVSYLDTALKNQRSASVLHRDFSATLYSIVGTGHHSKGGRDKVGKAVRGYLNDSGYIFREFSVPGDRGGSGGILGIDASSGSSRDLASNGGESENSPEMQHGKIRILKADEARELGL